MKRQLLAGLICTVMLATPIVARTQDGNWAAQLFSNENIGRAVGAGVGTYLGSKIGRGSGQTLATGAGAIGGYLLGGKIGGDSSNGSSSTLSDWSNGSSNAPALAPNQLAPLTFVPAMDAINSPYVAAKTSNVRGGPSTQYAVVDRLHAGQDVTVVGRVVSTDWFMIAESDIIRGFVYAPLLNPLGEPGNSGSGSILGGPVHAAPARYSL